MNRKRKEMDSPIGKLVLVSDGEFLRAVVFGGNRLGRVPLGDCPILERTESQLKEYFDGTRTKFDLPYKLEGTEFQLKVWKALDRIPFGETASYGKQAGLIGRPKAFRAVGRTNGLNPISIVLPCHRVVGSSGELTGYAGGLRAKKFLLELEKRVAATRRSSPS